MSSHFAKFTRFFLLLFAPILLPAQSTGQIGVSNADRPAGASQIAQYFNTTAFRPAAVGTFGSVGRNVLRGPNYADVDTSLFKDFLFTESWRLQFRAEAFNIQNRANLQNPVSTVSSGTFGRITSAYDPRVLQFALKLFF